MLTNENKWLLCIVYELVSTGYLKKYLCNIKFYIPLVYSIKYFSEANHIL